MLSSVLDSLRTKTGVLGILPRRLETGTASQVLEFRVNNGSGAQMSFPYQRIASISSILPKSKNVENDGWPKIREATKTAH
ncbi:hypothetical protein CEXT_492291 [Caerostris extrusa]|uniref:Uncharacterized protein n=1 Tax=Caerostris extrusa TaxID=172846 RepID=A0AAV4TSD5_CAEEX|nr:hypothetical protein CEXT_492291 [Caerostris extrusa]